MYQIDSLSKPVSLVKLKKYRPQAKKSGIQDTTKSTKRRIGRRRIIILRFAISFCDRFAMFALISIGPSWIESTTSVFSVITKDEKKRIHGNKDHLQTRRLFIEVVDVFFIHLPRCVVGSIERDPADRSIVVQYFCIVFLDDLLQKTTVFTLKRTKRITI